MHATTSLDLDSYLSTIPVGSLSRQFRSSGPIRHFFLDGFLRPEFFAAVRDAYPSYEEALRCGTAFEAVNEHRKVQVTDPSLFPPPVRKLSQVLASREFLEILAGITGIPDLVPDPNHSGGGMHLMDRGGRLDVHVDFNILPGTNLYRRLNLLLFTAPEWAPSWGGAFELWDPEVRQRTFQASPLPNRCVVFETSEISYHGVTPVRSPRSCPRRSFAAYYYTEEPQETLQGRFHSTIFRARPEEWFRERFLMPGERAWRRARRGVRAAARTLRRLGRSEQAEEVGEA